MTNTDLLLDEARQILARLQQAGFKAYLVGGFVRDHLLGKPVHDIDIATSAAPADVMHLFPRSVPTGLQHGTVTVVMPVHSFEVTTFRKDGEYKDHRRPETVEYVDSLHEDLARRDFTINAMAMDIDGQVIDPFGGQQDLKEGVLRCVGEAAQRFEEDALRMMRCIRFAANYRLAIDEEAWSAILALRPLMKHIAMERVRIELSKTIEGEDPDRGVQLLLSSRLLAYTKEELAWRPFAATGAKEQLLAELELVRMSPLARWVSLFLAGEHTSDEADVIARKLTFTNELRSRIVKSLRMYEHMRRETAADAPLGERDLRRIWSDGAVTYGREAAEVLYEVRDLYRTESWHELTAQRMPDWLAEMSVWSPADLAVSGRDVMHLREPKGPWISRLLHELTVDAAMGETVNEKQELLRLAEDYMRKWDLS